MSGMARLQAVPCCVCVIVLPCGSRGYDLVSMCRVCVCHCPTSQEEKQNDAHKFLMNAPRLYKDNAIFVNVCQYCQFEIAGGSETNLGHNERASLAVHVNGDVLFIFGAHVCIFVLWVFNSRWHAQQKLLVHSLDAESHNCNMGYVFLIMTFMTRLHDPFLRALVCFYVSGPWVHQDLSAPWDRAQPPPPISASPPLAGSTGHSQISAAELFVSGGFFIMMAWDS
eukprot:1596679-Amphidinium_carterae.1